MNEPMLAASLLKPSVEHTDENIIAAMNKLRYPVLATVKMDGIRAINLGDLASRSMKKIPNEALRDRALRYIPYGFDMELWNPNLRYDEVESIVMSRVHPRWEEIRFCILDWWTLEMESMPYANRILEAWRKVSVSKRFVTCEYPITCNSPQELFAFFKQAEDQQGEGICFRSPDSPYKQGRSTLAEQYLVKLARYVRTDCTVIGFIEQEANVNAYQRSFTGKMRRSTAGGGVGKGMLGAFVVKDNSGLEFTVGTGVGLTNDLRGEIWNNQDKYLGATVVVKSKSHGTKTKPRSPIWCGFRKDT